MAAFSYIRDCVARHASTLKLNHPLPVVDWEFWARQLEQSIGVHVGAYDQPITWLRAFAIYFYQAPQRGHGQAELMLMIGVVASEQDRVILQTDFMFGEKGDDKRMCLQKIDAIVRKHYRYASTTVRPASPKELRDAVIS